MGTNTPEFRTFVQCTSDLTNAFKPDVRPLSDDLLSEGFISQDNHSSLNNQMTDVAQRSSKLVSLVRTRVQLNATNFHKFISVLLKRVSDHKDILKILDEKYKSLGK